MQLKDVQVTASRTGFSQVGKNRVKVDSSVQAQFRYNSIADVLTTNSAVHLKSYGPGGLSSTSLRGGSAEQTAILWNGFNLQNTMLGQSDLALMPSMFFDELSVEYGGSSALWGSGAVGGSIHLNNQLKFGQGLRTTAGVGTGSYGLRNIHGKVLYSGEKLITSTKLFHSESVNDFEFMGTGSQEGQVQTQKRSGYSFNNLLQELKFLLAKNQLLTVNAWLNKNNRQLPSFTNAADSKTMQYDEAVRLSANWSLIETKFRSELRTAYFQDNVNYTDSLFPIYSKSKTQTVMLENENYFQWLPGQQINLGISALTTSAQSTYYRGMKGLSRISAIAGNSSAFYHERITVVAVARAEYFSAGVLPVTGTFAFDWKLFKGLSMGANFAKVYRQPTLNELYWSPGGNPELRPEQGYTSEGVIRYNTKLNDMQFNASMAAYSRKINDWVLWVPGAGGNPSPTNIQKVWSRGVETNWRIIYSKKNFGVELRFISAYVLSTIISNEQANNNSVDKQLIYTPIYNLNGNLILRFKQTSLAFFDQYVGYRFTSTDNVDWLPPYHVTSLKFIQQAGFKKIDLSLFVSCNNLFNVDYQVLENRPMPLRNFEFGISCGLRYNN